MPIAKDPAVDANSGATLVNAPMREQEDGPDAAPEGGPGIAPKALIAGRYQVLRQLGAGAMGTVFHARDRELDGEVAVKVLRREAVASPEMIERFRREVRLARLVTHHNVARTFDIGEHGGDRFITMEFIDGESLARRISPDRPPLPLPEALRILCEICAGLGAAHAAGVVHRDLKPDNIMICRDGRVVITDFGIARGLDDDPGAARMTTGVLGSPGYLAPEQLDNSSPVDARTDVYALGCLMYEVFTQDLPWKGNGLRAMLMARLLHPPPDPRDRRPELPETVALVTRRCMALSPEDRFARAEDVAAALLNMTLPLESGQIVPEAPAAQKTRREAVESAHRTTGPAAKTQGHGTLAGKTLAVLPFRNLGPAADEYLADGLVEDLIDTLSMHRALKVRPRGAVVGLKGSSPDPQEVGRAQGVAFVVEGSVRRGGGMLRIQVRLIGVVDGFQMWAQRFDRPEADVFAISDDVARAITAALRIEDCGSARDLPEDPRAQDLYLQARHEYHKPDYLGAIRAVELLNEALAIAPDNATLLSTYALARARMWFFGGQGSGELAREAAEKARKAAPERGEPLLAMAVIRFQSGDLPGATRDLRETIKRSPGLAEAYDFLSRILMETGPAEEGQRMAESAQRMDPGLRQLRLNMARNLALSGSWPAAWQLLDEIAREGDSPGLWVMRSRLLSWRPERGRAETFLRDPGILDSVFAHIKLIIEYVAGHPVQLSTTDPRRWLNAAQGSERNRVFGLQMQAELACLIGDLPQALEAVQQLAEMPFYDLLWLDHCPLFSTLRHDLRFLPFRNRVAERAREVQRILHE